jgi:hypothetical protein
MLLHGAALLLAATVADGGASPPAAGGAWATERVDLELTIAPGGPTLHVKGRLLLRLEDRESPGPTLELNARVRAMHFAEVRAEGAETRVEPPAPEGAVEIAQIIRSPPFRQGDVLAVDFVLEMLRESIQLRTTERSVYASWADRWYPVVRGAAGSPAARGSTTLRMPAGWRSVSNGEHTSSTIEDTTVVDRWESDVPAARSFVAALFAEARAVDSGGRQVSFHLMQPRTSAEAQAAALARALTAMEGRFGPFPYRRFDVVEVPEDAKFAASSEQGFIMVRASLLDDLSAGVPLFAHEAAHGWWGNLVRDGEGFGAKMVSEALAQYGAVLTIEALEGPAARDEFLRFSRRGYSPVQCALGYFKVWREGGDKALARLTNDRWDHTLADSKGMWFWHMLRRQMGDAPFFSVLRAVLVDYAGRVLTLDELRARFTRRDPSVAPFLAQWLDRPGAPVLRAEWWSAPDGKGIEIQVEQLQDGPAFVLPLDVSVSMKDGETARHTLSLKEKSARFTLTTSARPLELRLDPDHAVLMWRPEYGPRP